MLTVVVNLAAHAELLAEFVAGITENARASLRDEPGCLRFDVHQQVDDPTRFVLHEVYVDEDAFYTAHRSAPHYAAWQQVAARCVVPGTHINTFCRPLAPEEEDTA
ncbi:putative quinol monooxygenase [Modestobacter sp. URMC 112]